MSIESALLERSESKCELCRSAENLGVYEVPPETTASVDNSVLLCETCRDQIENTDKVDVNHWRCLKRQHVESGGCSTGTGMAYAYAFACRSLASGFARNVIS